MTSVTESQAIPIPSATEDPAAYQRALLEVAGDQDALQVMAVTPAKVRELCAGLTLEQVTQEPEPGEWSVAQILGHLFDVDVVYGFRWRLVLTEDSPSYPGYDEKLWAPLSRLPFWQMMSAWEGLRAANVAVLRDRSAAELQRVGVHGEQGAETLDVMIRKVAGHDLAHLNQMERAAWRVQH